MQRHRVLSGVVIPCVVAAAAFAIGAACPPRKPDASARAAPPPVAAAAAAPPSMFAPAPPGERVLVLYTASVQGYVEPCGCTADPLGGIARLAAVVEDARASYGPRVVVLDAGDLLFEKLDDTAPADLCQAEARVDLLLDAYRENGLLATVVGPLDDVRGAAFRDARLHARGVATLGLSQARALAPPATLVRSLLHDAGGIKVGVVGARVDDAAQLQAERAALESELKKLQAAGAQATLLLAQAPRELAKALAADLTALDVVILGRAPGETPVAPERLGAAGPVLVASAHQAQHVGVVELVLDGRTLGVPLALDDREAGLERRRKVLDVRIHELDTQLRATEDAARRAFLEARVQAARAERDTLTLDAAPPTGPHVVARALKLQRGMREQARAAEALARYRRSVPALVARCEASAPCPEPTVGAPSYVGATACKACHLAAWDFWQQQRVLRQAKDDRGNAFEREVGHARAWQTLVEDDKESDRQCVGCHSVGFGEPGGACKTSDIVARGLAGVQCESCHGPGSLHIGAGDKRFVVRATSEATCRACHRVPHIETTASFVFEEKSKLIVGPGHGAPGPATTMDGGSP